MDCKPWLTVRKASFADWIRTFLIVHRNTHSRSSQSSASVSCIHSRREQVHRATTNEGKCVAVKVHIRVRFKLLLGYHDGLLPTPISCYTVESLLNHLLHPVAVGVEVLSRVVWIVLLSFQPLSQPSSGHSSMAALAEVVQLCLVD